MFAYGLSFEAKAVLSPNRQLKLKFMALSDSVKLDQIVKDLRFDEGGPITQILAGFIEHFNMRIDNFKLFAEWSNAATRNIQLR